MNKDKLPLKLMSLVIAILLFLSVNNNIVARYFEKGSVNNETFSWIQDVPIEINYDKEKYYIIGLPNTISVKISGAISKVQKQTSNRTFKVKLDLSQIGLGDDQKVKFQITDLESGLVALTDPEILTVSVKNRVTREFSINPIIQNERLSLGYTIKSTNAQDSKVKISGAEESINAIYEVRAEPSEKTKINANIKEEAKLVAYDRNFNKIEDIEMEKTTTIINIEVEAIEKTLPITANHIGELPSNYELESINLEPNQAIIRTNNRDTLANINKAMIDVELSTINKETTELNGIKVYADIEDTYSVENPTVKVIIKVKRK